MKKLIYFLLLLIFVPESVFGQITGTGTNVDPYTGTIASPADNFTITGTKYFTYITVSGGTLTISPGATLLARTADASIIVSETGVLNANGTIGSIITFTADNNGDLSFQGTWGNILFDYLCSGASIINYAIIEKGTGDGYFCGGGIDIWGNNITISNSTIRNCNNSNGDGGGIFITPSGSNVTLSNLSVHNNISSGNGGGIFTDGFVTISGCEIYNNTATNGAGIYLNATGSISNSLIHDNSGGEGIYSFGTDASGSITNCIIYNNSTGIYFYRRRNVVNCTIVNNTTAGIRSVSGTAPKIVNTVLWGNATQYALESGGAMELAYCGIQGGFTVGTNGGGNKPLSAFNIADTGPNFVIPTSDFHINSWIAPIVDGGTASYTGVAIPGNDMEGKSRIGTLDIGAYEFTYFIWTGATSTDWSTSSNWVGSPASIPTSITDNKVVIPKGKPNYPTVASLSLLSTRSVLIMEPQTGLTVTGSTSVTAGCTFLLKSDATGSANFISGSSVSGSFNVELFLAGGGDPDYKWHFVTPPVASITKTVLTTDINNTNNLQNYLETSVTTDKSAGWNWHDGYEGTPGFTSLLNTYGYNVYVPTEETALFTGTVRNNTPFNLTNSNITFSSTDPAQSGWNLVGNPFTCAVNANNFTFGNRLDIDKTIYFTKDNQYCAWSVAGNAGINGATNIVPSMQGFFVHAASSGPGRTLTIPASSRGYTTNQIYKGGQGEKGSMDSRTDPYLKFNVSDGGSLTDESIIYFFADATTGFDGDYDAYKMLAENPARPQVYSVSNSIDFGINGLPFPDKKTIVPLNLRIGTAKNYTINVLNLDNLDDYYVTLFHGTDSINLKTNPNYTFYAAAGTMTDMSIVFQNILTNIPEVNIPTSDNTRCWYNNGNLYIQTNSSGFENNSSVIIYDLNGKVILSKNKFTLIKNNVAEIPVTLSNGLYITTIINSGTRVTKKIIVAK